MITLTRNEILYLYISLNNILKNDFPYSKIFLFYLDLNTRFLKDDAEAVMSLKESTKPSEQYIKFSQKKDEISQKYFVNDNGKLSLLEDKKEEFNKEYQQLINEYGKFVVEHDSYSSEIGTFLDQKKEIKIEKIPFKYIPEEILEDHYDIIKVLIKETDEELLKRYK